MIVAVCLQGVTYNPALNTGQLPGLDLENGHVASELEFAPRSRTVTPGAVGRSITIPVGLPELSTGPSSEQVHERREEEDKKSVSATSVYELRCTSDMR